MKAICLASSSAGNCFIFDLECGTRTCRIMVECGIPAKKIIEGCNANGVQMQSIEACLITHAHGDHCQSARNVASWGIPVFASEDTLENEKCLPDGNGHAMEPLKATKIADGVHVLPFPVEHDIEGAMGFVIKTARETILFINDCKRWTCDLSAFRFDYVFIECNYWQTTVYAQLGQLKREMAVITDSGEIKEHLSKIKQHERNINAHMSLAGCIRGLAKLNLSGCVAIFLMHLSDRFANEYEMKSGVEAATGVRTYVCKKKGGIK